MNDLRLGVDECSLVIDEEKGICDYTCGDSKFVVQFVESEDFFKPKILECRNFNATFPLKLSEKELFDWLRDFTVKASVAFNEYLYLVMNDMSYDDNGSGFEVESDDNSITIEFGDSDDKVSNYVFKKQPSGLWKLETKSVYPSHSVMEKWLKPYSENIYMSFQIQLFLKHIIDEFEVKEILQP